MAQAVDVCLFILRLAALDERHEIRRRERLGAALGVAVGVGHDGGDDAGAQIGAGVAPRLDGIEIEPVGELRPGDDAQQVVGVRIAECERQAVEDASPLGPPDKGSGSA